ncbi:hypothetical protein ACCT02_37930, partial [Rhizobium ruizarguesonis]
KEVGGLWTLVTAKRSGVVFRFFANAPHSRSGRQTRGAQMQENIRPIAPIGISGLAASTTGRNALL